MGTVGRVGSIMLQEGDTTPEMSLGKFVCKMMESTTEIIRRPPRMLSYQGFFGELYL